MSKTKNERVKNVTERYEKILQKIKTKKSRTLAIKAKCLDCCNMSLHEVKKCSIKDCPLWDFRPKGKKNKAKNEEEGLEE